MTLPCIAAVAAAATDLPKVSVPDVGAPSLLLPAAVLGLLAAAAWLVRRRRGGVARRIRVIETTSLGPKRQLVLVALEDEMLLLGASEGGIQLLSTRVAPPDVLAQARAAAAPGPFEALLDEPNEDRDLRSKLALGLSETVS